MELFDKTIRICLLISAFVFTSSLAKKLTEGFSIAGISSSRPLLPEYEVRPLIDSEYGELSFALNQPYTYFGRGGQVFVFFSEDGKYVLKFFKQSLYKQNWLLNHFPLPKFLHRYRTMRNWKRADKLQRDFSSYKIAFEQFFEETALLYVHLNPTTTLSPQFHFSDPLKIKHTIDLNRFNFIVQRRGENTVEYISRCMQENKPELAILGIKELLSLVSNRCKKGFRDRDPNLCTNCGIFEGKAMKIDVGRITLCEEMSLPQNHNAELQRLILPFKNWLQSHYPELLDPLDAELQEVLL